MSTIKYKRRILLAKNSIYSRKILLLFRLLAYHLQEAIVIEKLAVMGHPIGHTMSPMIHSELFRLEGIEASYEVFDIENLQKSIEELKELDAFNITIPYKEQIIPYIYSLDDKAELFGSVNTVRVKNNELYGYTTDGIGFLKALEHNDEDAIGNILILGNGGAARAIAFELAYLNKNANITFVCRESSKEKANILKNEINSYAKEMSYVTKSDIKTYEEIEDSLNTYDILVNATSVGMHPNVDVSPVSEDVISRCTLVFDAVYNPFETKLIKQAKAKGIKAIGGMYMLIYQAIEAHKIWYGTSINQRDVDSLCIKAKLEIEKKFT